jgi:hypothetical protein
MAPKWEASNEESLRCAEATNRRDVVLLVGRMPKRRDTDFAQPQAIEGARPRFAILDEDGRPILTDNQIANYEWRTHSITHRPGVRLDVKVKEGKSLVSGIPFTGVTDGVPCYRGVFTSSLSSIPQSLPVINLEPLTDTPGLVQIELGYPSPEFFKGEDPRWDKRVRETLQGIGKLR